MKQNHLIALAGVSLGLSLAASAAPAQVVDKPALTSVAAKAIGEACEALAVKNGWHLGIAVIGVDGNLLYFHRMDGATNIGADTAEIKARNAFYSRRPTQDMNTLNPTFIAIKGLMPSMGGLPIKVGDNVVGSVGVGGGVGPQDSICGQAGIDAVMPK